MFNNSWFGATRALLELRMCHDVVDVDNKMTEALSTLLDDLRDTHGGSWRKLARHLGVTDRTISSWYTGYKRPSMRGCKILSLATGLSMKRIVEIARNGEMPQGGKGNGDISDVTLPGDVEDPEVFDSKAIAYPAVVSGLCNGCASEAVKYKDRRERYCEPLAAAGLPMLCEAWNRADLRRARRMGLNVDLSVSSNGSNELKHQARPQRTRPRARAACGVRRRLRARFTVA